MSQDRFQPTYEELKLNLTLDAAGESVRFQPTYEELKPRQARA